MLAKTAKGREDHTFDRPGFYRQLSTLLLRDVMVAIRDPTLYYLQVSTNTKCCTFPARRVFLQEYTRTKLTIYTRRTELSANPHAADLVCPLDPRICCTGQLVLHMLYGFLVGSTFWNTPTIIDNRQNELTAACVWMIMLQSYIHVFKVKNFGTVSLFPKRNNSWSMPHKASATESCRSAHIVAEIRLFDIRYLYCDDQHQRP